MSKNLETEVLPLTWSERKEQMKFEEKYPETSKLFACIQEKRYPTFYHIRSCVRTFQEQNKK